jgi:hypothetical protein
MKNYYTSTKLLPELLPVFLQYNTKYLLYSSSNSNKITHTYMTLEFNQLHVYIGPLKDPLLPIFHTSENLDFTGLFDICESSNGFPDSIETLNFSYSKNYYQNDHFSGIANFRGFFEVVTKSEGL